MLNIRDRETGDLILTCEVLDGEKQYPFGFYHTDGGDFWLSALEAKELFYWLGEQFGEASIENE